MLVDCDLRGRPRQEQNDGLCSIAYQNVKGPRNDVAREPIASPASDLANCNLPNVTPYSAKRALLIATTAFGAGDSFILGSIPQTLFSWVELRFCHGRAPPDSDHGFASVRGGKCQRLILNRVGRCRVQSSGVAQSIQHVPHRWSSRSASSSPSLVSGLYIAPKHTPIHKLELLSGGDLVGLSFLMGS